jgi:hypothetical protein
VPRSGWQWTRDLIGTFAGGTLLVVFVVRRAAAARS